MFAESVFVIESRLFTAVHPRSDKRAVQHPQDKLQVAGKIYTPRNNLIPTQGDVTLVAAHANGFGKELYEPLFISLLEQLEKRGIKIRSILITDVVNQGESGVINENKLGDCFNWIDVSRDLFVILQVIDPPQPVIGIGHSFGGAHIFGLGILHPSIFCGIVGIDPIIETKSDSPSIGIAPAKLSSHRKDIWASKHEAVKYFKSRKSYQRWDPRVLDLWLKYGLRKLPTRLYPETNNSDAVTLTTTKYQEVWAFVQASTDAKKRRKHMALERPDPACVYEQLHRINIPVLYIVGGQSSVSQRIKKKMAVTKNAKLVTITDGSHFVPFEYVDETAMHITDFFESTLRVWQVENYADEHQPRDTKFNQMYVDELGIRSKL
ncbi:alpha/beta-hydrolase [Lipomyces arxii]|uniref:alpha/beta-hydrolase n=1 Tax=Lipomyces arxii TaxID=56418 RepID=UPI0034CF2965